MSNGSKKGSVNWPNYYGRAIVRELLPFYMWWCQIEQSPWDCKQWADVNWPWHHGASLPLSHAQRT